MPVVCPWFRCQQQVILDTLGKGGLAQQLKATDAGGKTLLMYVARHADVAVFNPSWEMVDEFLSDKDAVGMREARDNEGRTFLHHAAEARNHKMLGKVTCDSLRYSKSGCVEPPPPII